MRSLRPAALRDRIEAELSVDEVSRGQQIARDWIAASEAKAVAQAEAPAPTAQTESN